MSQTSSTGTVRTSLDDQLWDIVAEFLDAKLLFCSDITELASRARAITNQPGFDLAGVDADTWAGISVLFDVAEKGAPSNEF